MAENFSQRDPHEEFVSLYVQHQVAIRSVVRTLLPDAADAEELDHVAEVRAFSGRF